MSSVKITLAKNGPLLVSDPNHEVEVFDHNGAPITPPNSKSFALCRCGASVTKPFCDGTHSKIGFDAAAEAVPESKE